MKEMYDIIIIGGGIYGLYSATVLAKKKCKILILERDNSILSRASMVNQARVHNGLHYPRGEKTIESILKYRNRFIKDFDFCINKNYDAYYGISLNNSTISTSAFLDVMDRYDIIGKEINPCLFFNPNTMESLYKTSEFSFDFKLIYQYYKQKIKDLAIDIEFNVDIIKIEECSNTYKITFDSGNVYCFGIINATYNSTNGINRLAGQEVYNIDYELCEISLCNVPNELTNSGFTIMDGNFFSVMPFGFSSLHSLSSVHFTPHYTSSEGVFPCMSEVLKCRPENYCNCNCCPRHPKPAFDKMMTLYKDYMKPSFHNVSHARSYYAIKPILRDSYSTDDRITIIKDSFKLPIYISVLSGKFFTFYELESHLDYISKELT